VPALATILCIDDESGVLEMERALLESKGYKVLSSSDGPTGIALARKLLIHAVLLDFNMPGMDGNQVAQVLVKEHPTLPVVIWSGCLDEIPESLKWLADAVLPKGDGPETLLPVLEKIVSGTHTGKKPPARAIQGATLGRYARPLSAELRQGRSHL
jgi:CheY-like chemotaxis protein